MSALATEHVDLDLERVDLRALQLDHLHQPAAFERFFLSARRHGDGAARLLRLVERALELRLRGEQLRDALERLRALLRGADQVGLGLLESHFPLRQCTLLFLVEHRHLLAQLLGALVDGVAVERVQVDLLPELEHLHVHRARLELGVARDLAFSLLCERLLLAAQVLLPPAQLHLLVGQLADARGELLEPVVREDEALGELGGQLAALVKQAQLREVEHHHHVQLVELALLLVLEGLDVAVCLE
mmetsp:Transcript_3961/g.10084  ORF Transcript_3961/g.10084 Transcript_3961/m.10084 type:complete len:245 (+) Transcript_3961:216-950(+)